MQSRKNYIPALRFARLTRFYDPLVRIATKEVLFKSALVAQAEMSDGQNILDLACGTGTLSIDIKRRFPSTALGTIRLFRATR